MLSNNIIISNKSLKSNNSYNLIFSNIQYITELLKNNIGENNISEEALKSYYVDYYLSLVQQKDLFNFIEDFRLNEKVLYYIREGLKDIKAIKHLELFNNSLLIDDKSLELFPIFNALFREFQKSENLIELNYEWLKNHPNLLVMEQEEINITIKQQIKSLSKEQKHVELIKELCHKVNEEFLRITAGDNNNIYNRSYYFKTTKGHFYMIEKNYTATMYNSYSKKEVCRLQMPMPKVNKLETSTFYKVLAQIDLSISTLFNFVPTTHTKMRPVL